MIGLIPSLCELSLKVIELALQLSAVGELNAAVGPLTVIYCGFISVSVQPSVVVIIRDTV